MINCGMVVALGTDFNPNAHCLSMPMVMHLACVNLKMTLNEVRPKVADKLLKKETEYKHYSSDVALYHALCNISI